MTRKKLSSEQMDALCNEFTAGCLPKELALKYDIDPSTVRDYLNKSGISIIDDNRTRRRVHINENVFDQINESSAYYIGFIMGDGNLHYPHRTKGESPVITIGLHSQDRKHLEEFKAFLGSEHKIYDRKNEEKSSFSFSSKKIAKQLEFYGVTAIKSKTAKVKILEQNRDFWRGVICADGTLGIYDKKGYGRNNSGIYNIRYPKIGLVGSQELLHQFYLWAKDIVPESQAKVHPHKSIFEIKFSNRPAIKIVKALFEGAEVGLERKMIIAKEIMEEFDNKLSRKAPISLKDIPEICNKYIEGNKSTYELADEYNVTRKAISRCLKENNIQIRTDAQERHFTPDEQKDICNEYLEGSNIPEIALSKGVSPSLISRTLKRRGIEVRDQKAFDKGKEYLVIEKYIFNGMPSQKIADEMEVSKTTVLETFRRYGIIANRNLAKRKELNKDNPIYLEILLSNN